MTCISLNGNYPPISSRVSLYSYIRSVVLATRRQATNILGATSHDGGCTLTSPQDYRRRKGESQQESDRKNRDDPIRRFSLA